jgi:hypothetical protein
MASFIIALAASVNLRTSESKVEIITLINRSEVICMACLSFKI